MTRESEQFDHGADVGVRGYGATPSEAFEGAAEALFGLLAAEPSAVRPVVEERIACHAGGLEELLVAFLNELIFLASSRGLVFGRFAVEIQEAAPSGYRLRAQVWGEPYDPKRHESTVEPKGATLTALRVEEAAGRWLAQCVIDV